MDDTQIVDKDGNPATERHPFGKLEVDGVRLKGSTPHAEESSGSCWSDVRRDQATPRTTLR